MDSLKFRKGLEQNLPEILEKDTFYVTTDSKKIRLNDCMWEDTEKVKENISSDINELDEKIENVSSRIFIGTQEEYNEAKQNNKISVGALVIILNDNELENDTLSLL